MKKCVFLLDNGHGVDTPGKRSPVWKDGTQVLEWKFNRELVKHIAAAATLAGLHTVILVPEDDDVSLGARMLRANKFVGMADYPILISVHADAFGSEKANGVSVFTSPGNTLSDKIAEIVCNRLHTVLDMFGVRLRIDKSDGDQDQEAAFYVLTKSRMPAVLIENGFMTNERESHLLQSEQYQAALVTAYVQAMREAEILISAE